MSDAVFLGWYYLQNGHKVGPVSTEELVALTRAGKLSPGADVWKAWKESDHELCVPSHPSVALGNWKGNPRNDW